MKNCGYKVELYVDAESEKYFTGETFLAKFDKVHVVDFMQFPHDAAYWNFGKLYVYSLQTEPFLHVDFDIYFKPRFKIPEDGNIITEQLRDYGYVQGFKDSKIFDSNKIPAKLICSGLLGGDFYLAYRDLFSFAKEYCKKPPKTTETMSYLVGVEEFNLSQIADFYGLKVVELPKDSFNHWQGANKRERYGSIICDLYYRTFDKNLHR